MKNLIKKIFRKIQSEDEIKELADLIEWKDKFIKKGDEIVLGRGIEKEISFNLNDSSHLIVATPGAYGKTTVLKNILWQMIKKDFEVVVYSDIWEFNENYNKFEEVIGILEAEEFNNRLELLIAESKYRIKLIRDAWCIDIKEYNEVNKDNKIKRISVFIDNIESILEKCKDEKIKEKIEENISALLFLSKSTGIHVFLSIALHNFESLPSSIVDNISIKICGKAIDAVDSAYVLGNARAKALKSIPGRMIIKQDNPSVLTEFQAYNFNDEKFKYRK